MKEIQTITIEPQLIETLLAESGLTFEVVAQCPHPTCRICSRVAQAEAA
jgi:hypothetical protein